MDAPPQQEDCGPFLHVANLFAAAGAHVPAILAQDLAQGFLLLSDLGSTTYLQALNWTIPITPDRFYRDAVAALLKIQLASRAGCTAGLRRSAAAEGIEPVSGLVSGAGIYRSCSMRTRKRSLDGIFKQIVQNNLAQPRVFVHRDYHSRNLMVTTPNPGIVDFQDAVYGPITYDLVSLFKDAYIRWDEERILDWLIRYWEQARKLGLPVAADFADFYRDFEWMGVQRHIKVLGIFARLNYRDGKRVISGICPW